MSASNDRKKINQNCKKYSQYLKQCPLDAKLSVYYLLILKIIIIISPVLCCSNNSSLRERMQGAIKFIQ